MPNPASDPIEDPVRFVVNRARICLRCVQLDERLQRIAVEIDEEAVATLDLLPYWRPAFSIGTDAIAVYSNDDLYFVALEEGTCRKVNLDDVIHQAYWLGTCWCVWAELSVHLLEPATYDRLATWEHDEILVEASWDGCNLVIADLRERTYRFLDVAACNGAILKPE